MMVRRGKPEDIEAISELGKEFFKQTYFYDKGVKLSKTTVYTLLTNLLGDNGIICVAEDEGVVVGVILMALYPFPFNARHLCASELAFYITPEARKKGAGKLLLSKAEQVARQKGAKFLSMVALESGDPVSAAAVYDKLGYVKSEVVFSKDL